MGALYNQLLERLDRVTTERDAALADAQCQKTKAEELNWEFERLSKAASKKIESLEKDLAQAVFKRTPHDYGILKEEAQEMRKQRDEALAEVERLKEEVQNVNNRYEVALVGQRQKRQQRDKALAEAEQLKQALHDARLENSGQAMLLERKRPEPSRLEIAAMTLAARTTSTFFQEPNSEARHALAAADALIKAAKETK